MFTSATRPESSAATAASCPALWASPPSTDVATVEKAPLRRFFNTSGMKYRELGIKAKLDAGMTDEEAYELLATDGMLVKRPLIVADNAVLTGFKEDAWAEALL